MTPDLPDGVRLVRLGPDDWDRWRDVRLTALRDAPESFGTTVEDEAGRSDEEWRALLTPDRCVGVLAEADGDEPVGMVGGWQPPQVPGAVELYSMWVASAARGRGVGDALVAEVLAWARAVGAGEVLLWVTHANTAAQRLYARHGFRDAGREGPLPPHRCESERAMRLALGQAPARR